MMHATAVQIPCCLCGTMILPNAANKCSACLASQHDLASTINRGPGGGDIIVHQCRQCRRYQRTENVKSYQDMEPESAELLALCLKQIPALSSTAEPRLHIVDAKWIWTEPHSMRFRVHLTVRYDVDQVPVQQRVMVELRCAWKQCPSCNREYTNRTWHAVVQVRQQRHAKSLQALEMAIAKNATVRKHVLKIDAVKNGFDFYFLNLAQAQAFTSYLQRINPMRVKTSQKLVSTDVKNNTANVKHTVNADLVPLCRHDLVLIKKAAKGCKLAGRVVLVDKVSSVITLLDASPQRHSSSASIEQHLTMELGADAYYKNEKQFRVLQASNRLTRFVVLDVELCGSSSDSHANGSNDIPLYQGKKSPSPVSKYALANAVVARESDFGVNEKTFDVVTHLGHLIQAGDTVLGYDLEATVGGDWELDSRSLQGHYVLSDVVLVKKVASSSENGTHDSNNNTTNDDGQDDNKDAETNTNELQQRNGKKRMTKKREKRRQRREGKKNKELEASALRMGLIEDTPRHHPHHDDDEDGHHDFDQQLEHDPELAAELHHLETALNEAAFEEGSGGETAAEEETPATETEENPQTETD